MNFREWCERNGAAELLQCYLDGDNLLPPEQIGYSSGKKVNWKCAVCGSEWQSDLNHMNRRSVNRTVCPFCSHERASSFYNAAVVYPELTHYWDERNNAGALENYTPHSKYRAHWRCKDNHTWERTIGEQVKSVEAYRASTGGKYKGICPYCSRKRVSSFYNLEEECPDIAAQWNYSLNGTLTPRDVTPYNQKKVYWTCQFNAAHVWQDRISNRTVLLRGCPVCSRQFHISYAARAVYFYLHRHHVNCNCEEKVGRYSVDIVIRSIGSLPIALEIDGYYTHNRKDAQVRDARKDAYLRENGYRVIRVREVPGQERIMYGDDVITYPLEEQHAYLNQMIRYLLEVLVGIRSEPDHVKDHWEIERLYYHDRKKRSLAVKYPHLATEWSSKNPDTSDVVLPGSGEKRWWKCPDCKKEYEATIANRALRGSTCPFCTHQKVTPENSLLACFPEVAKEWHYENNTSLRPEHVLPGADKKVWWKCKENHEWQAYIYSRTGARPTKCPVCQGRTVVPETSLAAQNPALAAFWHPVKNTRSAEETTPHSNKSVWWRCKEGHEWQDMPNTLQKYPADQICPFCSNRRLWMDYCLESHNPELAKLLHPSRNAYSPQELAPYSAKRVWWQCPNGHEWEAAVSQMQAFAPNAYCPYCNDRRAWRGNSLITAAPELAMQWHPTRNAPMMPENVFPWSGRKVWWLCRYGHEWQAPVIKRYQRGDGCPYCSGRRASPDNCLAAKHPDIAAQWNSERNGELTPYDVTPGSGKKVWWKCEKGHEWQSAVIGRLKSKGCPICTREQLPHGSLAEEHPELLLEWDYEKNTRPPEQYRAHSNKKVWWICLRKHGWEATPDARSRGSGCPICAREKRRKTN